MKKIIAKFFLILALVLVLAAAVVAIVWGREIGTISSVEQVSEDNPYLYKMEYKAAYDLDEVIAADIDTNAKLLEYVVSKVGKGIHFSIGSSQVAEDGEADHCTSFQAANADGNGYFYGRNYDYFKNPSMVTYSHPKDGYASIAVSDMSHFGYSLEKLPGKLLDNILCIASVYAPVDGMNEKGLCTSIMALPKMAAQQNTGKHTVGTTILMRLFLDRCATVQEALDLLASVDVRHDATVGSGYHYMVADASGDCAVIEFDPQDGWKTMLIRKPSDSNYQLVTNHLLDPKYYTEIPDQSVGNMHSKSWERYAKAGEYLAERDGKLSLIEAQECLSLVHWKDLLWDDGVTVEDTQYSNVYDQTNLTLYTRSWYDYDTTVCFLLR